jgi:hypothetical protein
MPFPAMHQPAGRGRCVVNSALPNRRGAAWSRKSSEFIAADLHDEQRSKLP